ncbi:MAG: GNAT family N-acetyltransferase, partial [Kofleriaceae bacterium]
ILTGLFPLVHRDRYKGLPVSVLATWKHLYAYLGTPLVRADLANETLDALFDWLRIEATASVFEWTSIGADGAFRHALTDTLNRRGFDAFHDSRHTRAIFRPGASAEAYLEAAVPGKKRKELRRQERRLGELGAVTYDELPPDGDLEAWLDEFLALEERGWKGQGGTALRGDPAALEVFRSYARGAFARGRWMMLALRVGGQAIAVKCNLLAGPGAIALKIAYDESFARFSPGVLLEIENIRRLHERRPAVWMDSGASADHPMIGHLWRDRLAIETLVVPTGRPPGVLAIAAMPLVRWTSRAVRGALHRLRRKT